MMDVSGLVSSCYLSFYRLGCFRNDADFVVKCLTKLRGVHTLSRLPASPFISDESLPACELGETCADALLVV